MPPLLYILLGFAAGYVVGKRSPDGKALRREATAVLDSIGDLHRTGALRSVGTLKVANGSSQDGVSIEITPPPLGGPMPPNRQLPPPTMGGYPYGYPRGR